jgi:hypothetical protein
MSDVDGVEERELGMLFDIGRMGINKGNPSRNDEMRVRSKEYLRRNRDDVDKTI